MDGTVADLVRCQYNRYVAEVDVLLAAHDAARFVRAEDVVVHSSLAHDFLDQDDAGIALAAQVFADFFADDFAVVFLQFIADGLDDVVFTFMSGKRSRTGHAREAFDDGMAADDDVAFIGAARMAEIHLFIEKAFRRTEFMDLDAVFVDAGEHEYDTVGDFGDPFTEFAFDFRRNGRYVHDGIGVDVAFIGINDVEAHADAERVLFDGLFNDGPVDEDFPVFNGRLVADFDIGDFDVFLDELADDLLFARLFRRPCRQRASGTQDGTGRDIQAQAFQFIYLQVNRSRRCGCRGGRCSWRGFDRFCRCFGRDGLGIDFIQDIFSNRRQGFDILQERAAQDFFDGQAIVTEREQAGIDHVIEQRRVFQVIGSDDRPLGPAAAENGRICKVFL